MKETTIETPDRDRASGIRGPGKRSRPEPPGGQARIWRLWRRREELRVRRQELADRAGMHHSTLWRIEKGLTWPTQTVLLRLEEKLAEIANELRKALTTEPTDG